MTDPQLIESFRNGDKRSFDALYNRHNFHLVCVLNKHTNDYDQSNDIAQDTWLKVYRKIDLYTEQNFFFTWLTTIAINVMHDKRRIKSRLKIIPCGDMSYFNNKGGGEEKYSEEHLNELRENIVKIGHRDQIEVLYLRLYKDMNFRQITDAMKLHSINTTLGNYRYAKIKLRKLMKEAV